MIISNAMVETISVTLDVIFKASGSDIRLHGYKDVPDQPVLYVINHFTRMETIMMPYIIKKYIKKYPISLADNSLFVGKLGEILNKCGALSTADPNRDSILINALLTDSHPVIIFPEGQMIKDKKIVERGKYLIYNVSGRRPPHTGASRIALRSQFIREKLRAFRDRKDYASIARMASHFGFNAADVDRLIEKETYIVPVNITYYPIRARDNAISKFVSKYVHDISLRMREEMEVEGSMVMDGVDIDINFGKPISIKNYLTDTSELSEMMTNEELYLYPEELKEIAPFKKLYVDMMYDYMSAIYALTTVNHDHLASYILTKYRKSSFSENDFKNRIFLAIDHLLQTGLPNYHTSLNMKQYYLLTDDYHNKYDNFIKMAVSDNLITLKDGIITKNDERFSKTYEFHSIRKDNIIEVMRNEIEPLKSLTTGMDYLMVYPGGYIRQKIRNQFLEVDQRLFEEEYNQHYIHGESKPKDIGAPFFQRRYLRNQGVILVHGYMAAPEEIRPLADYLYKNGYTVYGARLRGHGTAPEDLAGQSWEKWYHAVGRAYIIMKNSTKSFAICGFSIGAGIALLQAANKPGKFAGIISINGPIRLQDSSSKFSPIVVVWNKILSKINATRGKMEFVSNDPENPTINYLRNPVSGVYELEKLMKIVKSRLADVKEPTLVIQGSDDPVVNPVNGMEIFSKLGSENKQLVKVNANHHGILRGKESDQVKMKVLEFIKEIFLK
jgi:esterase/lipase/1-acyl-sn-glycerol-3-phosphate acyltransferase